MNQIRTWLENMQRAMASKPKDLTYTSPMNSSCFWAGLDDNGSICLTQGTHAIVLNYDGASALRDWLNRLYTNGTNDGI